MRKPILLASLLCTAFPASAAPPQSDEQIRQALLGNWMAVPSATATPHNLLIRFKEGGTATAWFFKEPACTTVLFRQDVTWSVEGGVLITRYPEGYADHDDVEDISQDSITLLSRERREPYTRKRATACAPPGGF